MARQTDRMVKLVNYRRWSIWERKQPKEGQCRYEGYLPGTLPTTDPPEWQDDSLRALKEFIDSY